ncbi:37S ribosomal protein S24, mitochondrial [Malassezia obtusa]|uniref:37S ribosomal protein S24, mitochondrial n=1 Tax=Malassezia obtusa TaxID=76774 RepID=A0AAF0E108_9BASI|nr:37S ribosomal protein S24, mitochondrial [Malassezia obtusa]
MACRLPLAGAPRALQPSGGARAFHASTAALKPRRQRNRNNPFALNLMKHFQYDDIPTYGHMKLQRQRQMLEYYRLLQHELPQLEQLHEPFQPAPASNLLQFQFTHYQGERHPGARRVVLHVDLRDLFAADVLKTAEAKHKFLLLAGARWSPAQADVVEALNAAQQKGAEALAKAYAELPLGSLKIGCSQYPHESQNMKWCSDVLDRMLAEAQAEPAFTEIPLDVRPYIKSNARGGRMPMPSAADFPKEWL